jgi:hypothetical protein
MSLGQGMVTEIVKRLEPRRLLRSGNGGKARSHQYRLGAMYEQ